MLHLYLSKALAKPMGIHIQGRAPETALLLWKADIAQIGDQICVVANELQSNYLMVLCGLESMDFSEFPERFAERLWREASAICARERRYERALLDRHLQNLFARQYYQLDPQPPEFGRIGRTMEKLERLVLHEGQTLPSTDKEAFEFGIRINSLRSRSAIEAGLPSPLDTFGNICMGLASESIKQEQARSNPVISEIDNVIRVDFGRRPQTI